MNSVELFIFDTREFSTTEIVELLKLDEKEIMPFEKFANEEVKKEKIVSYFYKKHFAPDYYIDDNGKPQSFNLYFNISHSKGLVAFAFNKSHPIGIDIELIRPADESLKRYIANDEEFAYIDSDEKFYEIWTSKESYTKCIGVGIKGKPDKIPALPVNGIKNKEYFSRILTIKNYIVSITLNCKKDFDVVIHDENSF